MRKRSEKRIYTKDLFEKYAPMCKSFSELCRKFGIKVAAGGSYELIKNRCIEYNIDTSHFLGKSFYGGKRNPNHKNRLKPNDVFKIGHLYRLSHRLLKRVLIEVGKEYKCQVCSLKDWNGEILTLDIDHIDGDWSNCLLENLRFICPNCHRQTKTFGGKNKRVCNSEVECLTEDQVA